MRQITFLLIAVATVAGVAAYSAPASEHAAQEAAPIFVDKILLGYRDWRLISVAHEEGDLNDLRAILGNDVAIKAYREGTLLVPDGTIIAQLAWSYDPSKENNKIFSRPQSFVAGPSRTGCSLWSRTQKNTLRPAAGASLILTTASPPTRQCSTPASLATRRSKIATWSSPVTHLDSERHRMPPAYDWWRETAELGYEVTVVKDATAGYSDEMHAALDVNIPNYASVIVTTHHVVDALASVHT